MPPRAALHGWRCGQIWARQEREDHTKPVLCTGREECRFRLLSEGAQSVDEYNLHTFCGNRGGPKMRQREKGHSMATTAAVLEKRRLNINLSPAARTEVTRLAEHSSRSITELVRLALSLLKVVMNETERGHKLIVTTEEGKPLKELVIPGL